MKSKEVQALIHKIAINNGLSDREVKKMIASCFKFTYIVASNTGSKKNGYDFKSIMIPFFGKFRLNNKALKNVRASIKTENNEED